jgi:hypothetical protein
MRFGRLVAQQYFGRRANHTFWVCTCDCGNEAIVRTSKLRDGRTKSCGCLFNERNARQSEVKQQKREQKLQQKQVDFRTDMTWDKEYKSDWRFEPRLRRRSLKSWLDCGGRAMAWFPVSGSGWVFRADAEKDLDPHSSCRVPKPRYEFFLVAA